MPRLFIRIKGGVPFEHPIIEGNFRTAFPNVDVDNLPNDFAEFVRTPPPVLGPYEKNQQVRYGTVGDKLGDIWTCSQMTSEERAAKIKACKDAWAADPDSPASWSFVEDNCRYEAPIPRPTGEDSEMYYWDESVYQADTANPKTKGWVKPAE